MITDGLNDAPLNSQGDFQSMIKTSCSNEFTRDHMECKASS